MFILSVTSALLMLKDSECGYKCLIGSCCPVFFFNCSCHHSYIVYSSSSISVG